MALSSPKGLRARLLDRFRLGTRHSSLLALSNDKPLPIFGTDLRHATMVSRIRQQAPLVPDANMEEERSSQDILELYRFWCPAIVVRAIDYLNRQGLDEEGLYRVPGSSDTVKRLKNEFDRKGDIVLNETIIMDGHHTLQIADIASLLKQYLRELPGPMMSEELVKDLEGVAQTVASIRITLSAKLQPYEFYLLSMLYTHLSEVDAHHSTNKMDLSNLAIVFCSSSNLGIGSNLFSALAKTDVWDGLRCLNETEALVNEQVAT